MEDTVTCEDAGLSLTVACKIWYKISCQTSTFLVFFLFVRVDDGILCRWRCVPGSLLELWEWNIRDSCQAIWQSAPKTFKRFPPFILLIPFLGIYPGETIKSAGRDPSARMFIPVLFLQGNIWKPLVTGSESFLSDAVKPVGTLPESAQSARSAWSKVGRVIGRSCRKKANPWGRSRNQAAHTMC